MQRNGGYGGSVPCVVSLMGCCAALNLLSATCTGSASIKNEALEHQTHLWAPRFLTRDRRESRPKERLGSQEGQGNLGVPAPFVSAGRPRHSPAAGRRPLSTPSEGVKSPPAAAPLYRRKVHRQQTVKKTARPPERRQVSPLCQGENLFYFSS